MEIQYQSLTPEQTNELLTTAMNATVNALIADGLCDGEKGDAWMESHACLQASQTGWLRHWVKKFFPSIPANHSATIIVQVTHRA